MKNSKTMIKKSQIKTYDKIAVPHFIDSHVHVRYDFNLTKNLLKEGAGEVIASLVTNFWSKYF